MKYRTILMFGAPGVGKGTVGKVLGTIPHFLHCSSGELFRNLPPDSPIGKLFQEYAVERGLLVPDEPTIQLWSAHIDGLIRSGRFNPVQDTLVLDGIPRNVDQVRMLRDRLDVVALFFLRCPNQNRLITRLQQRALKENRGDDASIDVIRRRLEVYERETHPVLDCYDPRLLHYINGDQDPVRVIRDVMDIMANGYANLNDGGEPQSHETANHLRQDGRKADPVFH